MALSVWQLAKHYASILTIISDVEGKDFHFHFVDEEADAEEKRLPRDWGSDTQMPRCFPPASPSHRSFPREA